MMLRLLVFLLVLACCAIPASATLTTYADAASFNLANPGNTFITFPPTVSGTNYTDAATDVGFSDAGGTSTLEEILTPSGWPTGSSLQATACSPSPSGCITTLTIDLPSAVTSVGMYIGLQSYNDFQIAVSNTGGGSYSANNIVSTPSSSTFFGVSSDSPFSTFTIATESYFPSITIDDLQIGTSGGGGGDGGDAQAPEAATFLMIGSGLIMLHFGRRWLPRVS
jgi:hypothetical protein